MYEARMRKEREEREEREREERGWMIPESQIKQVKYFDGKTCQIMFDFLFPPPIFK